MEQSRRHAIRNDNLAENMIHSWGSKTKLEKTIQLICAQYTCQPHFTILHYNRLDTFLIYCGLRLQICHLYLDMNDY